MFGGFGPDEGLGVVVPVCDPGADVVFEGSGAVVVTSLEQVGCDVGEESFHLVDPAGVRRGEVHMESGVGFQPSCDGRGFVGAVVITDDMHLKAGRHLGIDFGQEFFEFDRAVPAMNAGDHGPVSGIERREQTGHTVPHVVVGAFFWHAGHHRKRRLGSGESLNLGLLIHGIHHCTLGRVQIQADNVIDLVDEQGVVGEFESVGPVGFEFEFLPDSPDRGFGQPTALGHLGP